MDQLDEFTLDRNCESDSITHSGVINKTDDKYYFVSIISQNACSGCYSKGICNVTELSDKVIMVSKKDPGRFKVGDEVEVVMKKSLAFQAVFLGYLLPFIILFAALLITYYFSKSEGWAGLAALGILIPYYLVLYLLKDRLKSTFVFSIR